MCGICGMFDIKLKNRCDAEIIRRMTSVIKHRGPDASDFYIDENVALGFARLSIIDLANGMQPITNEDGSLILICNGEIFNYQELKKELIERGHKFRSNCDVEVILHLYEENGTSLVDYLNGQFAIALYDVRNKSLFCARDYAGIAPFFYTIVNGLFIFASEIKAILQHPWVKREVDMVGLDQIMTFPGLISPRTMFKNIHSLENGHCLLIRDENITDEEYWDLNYPEKGESEPPKSESFYMEKLDDLLTKAVKYRLQSDVPVGFYLSGGLDSSMIAAKIRKLADNRCRHSFSIDFTDKNISEGRYQREMAKHIGSIHTEKLFLFSDLAEKLKKVIYHCETPIKETYNTASIALSQMAMEKGIKVILTGEGADELFGGYIGYRFDQMRKPNSNMTEELERENELRLKIWGDKDFVYEKNYASFSLTKKSIFSKFVKQLYDEVDCTNSFIVKKERIMNRDVFHQRSYVDFKLRMSDHLLSDHGDRMAFANSIEARYPFLDKNLIEFATSIPIGLKLKNFTEKYILKKIAEKYVPADIIKRPKFAFTAPGSPEILKQNVEYVNDILSYERIKRQGYFDPDVVEKLKQQYMQPGFRLNVPYDDDMLIIVLTFGIWMETFQMPCLI